MLLFKPCISCEEELPYYCFHSNLSRKDGLGAYCKLCNSSNTKKRYVKLRYRIQEQVKNYQVTHKDDVRASRKLWASKPENKIIINIKDRVRKLRRNNNFNITCSLNNTYAEIRNHIKSLWTSEMNWKNYGKVWEIDHIVSIHLLKDKTTFNNLNNLRPILKKDHKEKSKKELIEIKKILKS